MEIWKFLGDLPWDLGPSGLQPAPSGDHLHPAILVGVSDPGYLLSLRGLHGQGVWDGEGQHTDIRWDLAQQLEGLGHLQCTPR